MNKFIGITGTGRCGTKYAAKYFREVFKLDVKHEVYGKDGISSLYLANDPHYEKFVYRTFLNGKMPCIFHQVREPMHVISSLRKRDFIRFNMLSLPELDVDDLLVRSAIFYLHWNRKISKIFKKAFRYKVEDMRKPYIIKRFAKILEVPYNRKLVQRAQHIDTTINTSYHWNNSAHTQHKKYKHVFTLDELKERNIEVGNKIELMAKEFGY